MLACVNPIYSKEVNFNQTVDVGNSTLDSLGIKSILSIANKDIAASLGQQEQHSRTQSKLHKMSITLERISINLHNACKPTPKSYFPFRWGSFAIASTANNICSINEMIAHYQSGRASIVASSGDEKFYVISYPPHLSICLLPHKTNAVSPSTGLLAFGIQNKLKPVEQVHTLELVRFKTSSTVPTHETNLVYEVLKLSNSTPPPNATPPAAPPTIECGFFAWLFGGCNDTGTTNGTSNSANVTCGHCGGTAVQSFVCDAKNWCLVQVCEIIGGIMLSILIGVFTFIQLKSKNVVSGKGCCIGKKGKTAAEKKVKKENMGGKGGTNLTRKVKSLGGAIGKQLKKGLQKGKGFVKKKADKKSKNSKSKGKNTGNSEMTENEEGKGGKGKHKHAILDFGLNIGKETGKALKWSGKTTGKVLKWSGKRTGKVLQWSGKKTGKALKWSTKKTGKALKWSGKKTGKALKWSGKQTGKGFKGLFGKLKNQIHHRDYKRKHWKSGHHQGRHKKGAHHIKEKDSKNNGKRKEKKRDKGHKEQREQDKEGQEDKKDNSLTKVDMEEDETMFGGLFDEETIQEGIKGEKEGENLETKDDSKAEDSTVSFQTDDKEVEDSDEALFGKLFDEETTRDDTKVEKGEVMEEKEFKAEENTSSLSKDDIEVEDEDETMFGGLFDEETTQEEALVSISASKTPIQEEHSDQENNVEIQDTKSQESDDAPLFGENKDEVEMTSSKNFEEHDDMKGDFEGDDPDDEPQKLLIEEPKEEDGQELESKGVEIDSDIDSSSSDDTIEANVEDLSEETTTIINQKDKKSRKLAQEGKVLEEDDLVKESTKTQVKSSRIDARKKEKKKARKGNQEDNDLASDVPSKETRKKFKTDNVRKKARQANEKDQDSDGHAHLQDIMDDLFNQHAKQKAKTTPRGKVLENDPLVKDPLKKSTRELEKNVQEINEDDNLQKDNIKRITKSNEYKKLKTKMTIEGDSADEESAEDQIIKKTWKKEGEATLAAKSRGKKVMQGVVDPMHESVIQYTLKQHNHSRGKAAKSVDKIKRGKQSPKKVHRKVIRGKRTAKRSKSPTSNDKVSKDKTSKMHKRRLWLHHVSSTRSSSSFSRSHSPSSSSRSHSPTSLHLSSSRLDNQPPQDQYISTHHLKQGNALFQSQPSNRSYQADIVQSQYLQQMPLYIGNAWRPLQTGPYSLMNSSHITQQYQPMLHPLQVSNQFDNQYGPVSPQVSSPVQQYQLPPYAGIPSQNLQLYQPIRPPQVLSQYNQYYGSTSGPTSPPQVSKMYSQQYGSTYPSTSTQSSDQNQSTPPYPIPTQVVQSSYPPPLFASQRQPPQ